jgi:predicted nuclease of predicted toxin-antitoxin system
MSKFLANENVPAAAIEAARAMGYNMASIKEIMPGAADDAVLAKSLSDGRVLITFDKDFGEMTFRRGRSASAGVILLRPRLRTPGHVTTFMLEVVGKPAADHHKRQQMK